MADKQTSKDILEKEKENEEIRLALLNILEDVKESEEELKSLAKFPSENPNPVFRISKDGEILYSNKPGLEILKKEKALEKELKQQIKDVFKYNQLKTIEYKIGENSYSFNLSPVKEMNYVNIYGLDITNQKKSELKILKQKSDYEKEIITLNLRLSKLEDKKRTPKELSRFQRDTLKEVASIGANSASTALSKLTNKFITVTLTKLNIMSFDNITKYYDGKSNIGVVFEVSGGVSGAMITLCSEKSTLTISDLINGNKPGTTKKLSKENVDIIKEVGNILVGSYLSALSNMSKINMLESIPTFVVDSTDEIIKQSMKKIKKQPKEVIFIENLLVIGKKRIKQEIILILMPTSLDKLFNSLFKDL